MSEAIKKGLTEGKINPIDRSVKFLKKVKLEAKKITWAGRKQVLMSSLMVILLSLFIGAYLGLLDMIYNFIITLLVS